MSREWFPPAWTACDEADCRICEGPELCPFYARIVAESGIAGTVVKVEAVGPVERHEVTLPAWASEEYRIKRVEPMIGSQDERMLEE